MLSVRIAVWISLIFMVDNSQAMICSIGREPSPANDNELRWVIPVPDPCQCTEIRLGGINARTPCRPFDVTYHDTPMISNDHQEIWKWLECSACDSSPCLNDGLCTATGMKYSCTCFGGYQGLNCEHDTDECELGSHTCDVLNHETCVNTPGGFDCVCKEGYQHDGESCKDTDECAGHPEVCNAVNEECTNNPGSFECVCQSGYRRVHRGDGIELLCEEDINECDENTHKCNASCHEKCSNVPGSYECVCQDGYQRSRSDGPCEACHFSTVPHPRPYSYMFILEPQIAPFTVNFSVETGVTAMVGLSEHRTDQSVVIEILFGFNPARKGIVVRACMPHLCSTNGDGSLYDTYQGTSPLIDSTEYRPLWFHYNKGVVTAGKGGQQENLVEWDAGAKHGRVPTQLHIGISTWENGHGEWDFCQPGNS